MTRTRRLSAPDPAAPHAPLPGRLREGAVQGGALALYVLLGLLILDRISQPTFLGSMTALAPRAAVFILGLALAGASLKALKPAVRSVYEAVLLAMLCLVPTLLSMGVLILGWRPAAFAMLVFVVPLGVALGFIDWNNLYRHARARRSPPSA